MSVPRRRHELLHTRLERFTRTLPQVEAGDVRGVHHARVGSRRLRELIPVLQLEGNVAKRLNHRLRKATRRLGTLRELDVLLKLTAELRDGRRYPAGAVERVAAEVTRRREKAGKKLPAASTAEELRRLARRLGKLERRLAAEPDDPRTQRRVWEWAVHARVARRAAALKKAADSAGALYLAERLHAVRIALKKLRYGVELLDEAEGGTMRRELNTLKRVQGLLGRLHDLQVLVDQVRRIQAALDPPDLLLWHDLSGLVTGLEQSGRRLHARYVRERDGILELCHQFTVRAAAASRGAVRRAG